MTKIQLLEIIRGGGAGPTGPNSCHGPALLVARSLLIVRSFHGLQEPVGKYYFYPKEHNSTNMCQCLLESSL